MPSWKRWREVACSAPSPSWFLALDLASCSCLSSVLSCEEFPLVRSPEIVGGALGELGGEEGLDGDGEQVEHAFVDLHEAFDEQRRLLDDAEAPLFKELRA